jgi:hypothetical protein
MKINPQTLGETKINLFVPKISAKSNLYQKNGNVNSNKTPSKSTVNILKQKPLITR